MMLAARGATDLGRRRGVDLCRPLNGYLRPPPLTGRVFPRRRALP